MSESKSDSKNHGNLPEKNSKKVGILRRLHHNIYGLALLSCFNQLGATFVYVTGLIYLRDLFSAKDLLLMRMFTEAVPYALTPLFGLVSDYLRDRKLILWIGYGSMFFIKIGYLFCSFFKWLPPWITPYIPIAFVVLKSIDRMMDGGRDSSVQALMSESLSPEDLKTGFAVRKAIASTGSILGGLGAYFLVQFGWSQWEVYALALVPVFLSYGFLLWMVRDISKHTTKPKQKSFSGKSSLGFFQKIFNTTQDLYNNLIIAFLFYKLSCMQLSMYLKLPIFGFLCCYEYIAGQFSFFKWIILSAVSLFINRGGFSGNIIYILSGIYGCIHLLQIKYEKPAKFMLFLLNGYLAVKGMSINPPNSLRIAILITSAFQMCINSVKRFTPSCTLTLAGPLMSFKVLELLGFSMNYYPICFFAWLWRWIDSYFPQHMKKFTKMLYGLLGFLGIYKLLGFYPGLGPWISGTIIVFYGFWMSIRRNSCQFFFAYPLAICFAAFLKTYGVVGFFQSGTSSLLAMNSMAYLLNKIFYGQEFSIFNLLRQGTSSLLLYNSFLAPLHLLLNAINDKFSGRDLITLRNLLHSLLVIIGYVLFSIKNHGINIYTKIAAVGIFSAVWVISAAKRQMQQPLLSTRWHRDVLSFFVLGLSAIIFTKSIFAGCVIGLFLFPILDFFFDSEIGRKIQKSNLNRYYLVLFLSSFVGMGIINKTLFLNCAALLKTKSLAGSTVPTDAMIKTGRVSTILMFVVLYVSVSIYSAISPLLNNYPIMQALIFFTSLMTAHALPLIFKNTLSAWIGIIFLAISIGGFNVVFSSIIGNSIKDDGIKGTLFSIYNTVRGIVKIATAVWINQWVLTGSIGGQITTVGYFSVFKNTLFIQIAAFVFFLISIPWIYEKQPQFPK
jgi:MFS family permease